MVAQKVFIFLLLQTAFAHVKFDNHKVLRIHPQNDNEVLLLRDLETTHNYDFWKSAISPTRYVDVRLTPSELEQVETFLADNNIDYYVMISNVQQMIDSRMGSKQRNEKVLADIESFDYEVYHGLDEIEEWGDVLAAEFSEYVTKFQIGVSYEGRPLNTIEIRKPSGSAKQTLYIDSLTHAREWVSGGAALFTIKEMLINPEYAWMLDEFDWIYVPVVNVDGYDYSFKEDPLWRKTRSPGPGTCIGVDPNRNFDSHWSEPGASGNPCSDAYYGPTPVSENVVRHLSDYIFDRRDEIVALMSIHSYSQLILYPFGYTTDPAPQMEELDDLGKQMHDAVEAVHGMNYTYGQASTTIYVTSADTTDWAYDIGIYKSYTYELRDEGQYGFLLPEDQIIPTGEEFLAGMVALAEFHSTTS